MTTLLSVHGRARQLLRPWRSLAVLLALFLGACASMRSTPRPTGPSMQRATRSEINARVADLERQIAGGTLRGSDRGRAATELSDLRKRLQDGDFGVGDKFMVTVTQDSVRTDTVTVLDSLIVSVATLPPISVKGVLRSELTDKVNAHLARYLRNVTVRTQVLTRLSVLGAVGTPGFYYVSPEKPVGEIVMMAGGPAPNANLNRIEVWRGGQKVLADKESEQALKDGRTLEELNVRSGDEVRIPLKKGINWQLVLQLLFIASSLFFAVINFLRWYYEQQS